MALDQNRKQIKLIKVKLSKLEKELKFLNYKGCLKKFQSL